MRHTGRRAFTLIECLVVLAIFGLIVVFFVLPRLSSRRGPLTRRLVCESNLKGIGTACKIYANDNNEEWPTPAFDQTAIGGIAYTVRVGGGEGSVRSPNRTQPSIGGSGGARQLSTTRAFWMLVRSGDVTEKQFICPQSKMTTSQTKNIDANYDFASGANVSYGFQVPFGPAFTRATEGKENRMALIADRGPYRTANAPTPPLNLTAISPRPSSYGGNRAAQTKWRPFGSPNHQGEGQNVLFADGHSEFVRFPTAGVDGDNIYTIATDTGSPTDYTHGESPWRRSAPPRSLPNSSASLPSTDSVIFP
jgi:prepilin-type N-terminal cleavage/methylation domain-containing protein/prepilin-type processing-associated H-X9-DG protein